ncbi:hypothetical protein L1049_014958 [Liquidambar formosana]|uniref:Legume lectin domain-containing protein n=1 Tax=Liquidambar formosana TaxID=63359 RepID=A0AAP0RY23_LIQFO
MGLPKTNLITLFILVALLHLAAIAAASEPIPSFNITGFNEKTDATPFAFVGSDPSYPSIDDKALQLTRDTYDKNDTHDYTVFHNKSGRAMYNKSFKLWHDNLNDDAILASFNSTFVINLWHDNLNWKAGHGLAFLIAPNVSIPEASYGQWMGLSNGTTDGNRANQIVAIEFDTKQDGAFDPDDNHVGLNINSIRSNKTIPLSNFSIQLSPPNAISYSVWVQYDGKSKLMEVYMVKEGDPKPDTPLLNETINLKDHVNQESYFGFSASTGDPEIQFNCVLKWSLAVENFPKKKDWMWLKVGAPAVLVLILFVVGIGVVYMKKKRRTSFEESDMLGTLKRLPGMPREFRCILIFTTYMMRKLD